MIELGKIQKLKVNKKANGGAFLVSIDNRENEDVLLPKNQVPEDIKIGDTIEVFIYRDSEDRLTATTRKPKLTIDELAVLRVAEISKIGAFMDWGLEKDLFLPFKQQVGKIVKGGTYLVGMYVDNSKRLCATMKISNILRTDSPYKANDWAKGTIYSISHDIGAFVAVDNKYHGLIPNNELTINYSISDYIDVRIKKVKPDGKLELSLRRESHNQMETDARKIMDILKTHSGKLPLNDDSSPEKIKKELNMSKAAFKRAVGRLMKEGAVKITDKGIEMMW